MNENADGGRGTRRRARRRLGLPFAALAGIALLIAACGGGNSSGAAGASLPATTPAPPFLYAVNTKSDEVSQYTINQNTGRLTPKSPATVASGRGPVAIAVASNGKSAYVVSGPNAIWQYNINPTTGALTPKSAATVATGPNPEPIAVTPNGKYAYVANCPGCSAKLRNSRSASPSKPATNTIWEYRINQSTGALRPKPIAIVAIGTGANAIAITPDSKSLYVAVARSGNTPSTPAPAGSRRCRPLQWRRQAARLAWRTHPDGRQSNYAS